MSKPTESIAKVTHVVVESAEKLRDALAKEWQAAQDELLDEAHGATREDRPFAGCHPCEPADTTVEAVVVTNPDAEPQI